MPASLQSQPYPLTPEEWGSEFIRAIKADFQTHDDPLISRLLTDADTLHHVADHVRRYVTDFWKEANEDRSLFGAEIRHQLLSAIAGQKTTIKIFEAVAARLDSAQFGSSDTLNIDPQQSLETARALLRQLEFIQEHAPDATNVKSMGYKGDLQTLCSLDCFLRHRLGESSFDTLATLLDCGRTVEGQEREVEDGKNLKNRLDGFRQKKPWLAEQTEASAHAIPRK